MIPSPSLRSSIVRVLSSSSCTSTTWSGARPICEYCLAAPTRTEMRVVASSTSVMSELGLERVGEPADRTLEHLVADVRSPRVEPVGAEPGGRRSSRPAPSRRRCRARPSSRRRRPRGRRPPSPYSFVPGRARRAASASTAFSCSVDDLGQLSPVVRARRRSAPSLWRIPATRSRRVAVARVAAAAGLFSSCVRPADSDAERQQPLALADRLLRALLPEEQALEQVDRHREPVVHEAGEVVGGEHVASGTARGRAASGCTSAAPGRRGRRRRRPRTRPPGWSG